MIIKAVERKTNLRDTELSLNTSLTDAERTSDQLTLILFGFSQMY